MLSKPGDEYWNASIPFEGAMVDYLDQLQELAAGDFSVEWTFGVSMCQGFFSEFTEHEVKLQPFCGLKN